jgi:hypothetical protein
MSLFPLSTDSASWGRPGIRTSGLILFLGLAIPCTFLGAQETFPHDKHAVFFPECTACHVAAGGEEGDLFPEASTCTACHDGSTQPRVDYEAPEPRLSSLRFTHTPHTFDCATCHLPQGEENLAVMAFPEAESCLECHAPEAESHKLAEDCSYCHAPVVDFRLSENGMPPFHAPDFETSHAAAAAANQPECTSCHAESTCLHCHDGQRSPSFHPVNFLASHSTEAFGRVSDCSSCHNPQAFCRECHLGLGIQGSGQSGLAAPYHDGQAMWTLSHGQAARQDLETCVSCHQQTDCLRCHAAGSGMGVNPHGPGFSPSSLSDRNPAMCTVCHGNGGGGGGNP